MRIIATQRIEALMGNTGRVVDIRKTKKITATVSEECDTPLERIYSLVAEALSQAAKEGIEGK